MTRARRSCKAGGKPYRLTSTLYRVKPGKGGLRMILRPKHASFPSVCPPTYTVLPPNEGLKLKICKNKPVLAEGYRLLNLDLLRKHILQITLHVIQCPKVCDMKDIEPLKLFFDERNLGLASVMFAECQGCHKQFKFTSSPMLSNDMFDVNVRGVWGSMVTGDGGAQLGETMATFSCPSISSNSFTKIETEISKWWLDTLQEDILAAGIEERNLAIDRNDFFQGVPAITVICDGGWSKRAHKHTYNALGGVAIIIGAATGKILHVGVRNKFCYICKTAQTKGVPPKAHECFMNWTGSSQAMEADIIVEGFLEAERKHGVRYMRLVADGDSSVEARIRQHVPVWGQRVEKIECANHACKCLRSHLEQLVMDKPSYKGKNKLTKANRLRITSSIRCAIRRRAQEENRPLAIRKLKHDILNTVNHVFGIHENCSDDFCKVAKQRKESASTNETLHVCTQNQTLLCMLSQSVVEDEISTNPTDNEDVIASVLDEQSTLWSEISSLTAQEESRGDSLNPVSHVDPVLRQDISRLLVRLENKASSLITCQTTNLAENWMSIRAKFDGGKFYNRVNRGSWHARCYGGGLRKNFGPKWSPTVWEKVTGTKAGQWFDIHYNRRSKKLLLNRLYKSRPEYKARAYQRKIKSAAVSAKSKSTLEYGKDALECIPDVSSDTLQADIQEYLGKHINVDEAVLTALETQTKEQSHSGVWHEERRKRITASAFADVVRRNPGIKVEPLVRRFLYSTFRGNCFTRKGLQEEANSKKDYILNRAVNCINVVRIEDMGLVVSREHPFLGASTDGKVFVQGGECGLIEIKNVLHNNTMSIVEATQKVSNFPLERKNGNFFIKKSHSHYHQIQGQLNILNCSWCDFVVRRTNPFDMVVLRIIKDVDLWVNTMVPKLKAFYFKALLPELVHPRHRKQPGIREPGVWFEQRPKAKPRKRHASCPDSPLPLISAPVAKSSRKCQSKTKFLNRRISHKWIIDEASGTSEWYAGTVTSIVSGVDGAPDTIYDVQYDNESEAFEVDHLQEDLSTGSLKFL